MGSSKGSGLLGTAQEGAAQEEARLALYGAGVLCVSGGCGAGDALNLVDQALIFRW